MNCQAPERIGKYELEELVGEGGMGRVWRARDTELKRIVALKLLQRSTDEDLARFRREARAIAGLSHPNIAQLYDFSDAPPFLAMQFIDGVPLNEAPESQRLSALRDASRAVAFAHHHGLIHRDLKPGNILVDRLGRAFVLDFGLARETRGDRTALTLSGDILGTPAFMAPEQANGLHREIDPRTDVYGLGATLYLLLAGFPPHTGPSPFAVLRSVMENEPGLPPGDRDLVTICMKAIEKDPERRYASADEFADDLDRFLRKEPVRARPASTFYRWKKRVQRQPVVWSLGALLVASIFAGAAFGVLQLVRVAQKEREARLASDRARDTAENARLLIQSDSLLMTADSVTQSARADLEAIKSGLYMRGFVLNRNRVDFAHSLCRHALEISPHYVPAIGCEAEALMLEGRDDVAIEFLEREISALPPFTLQHDARDLLWAQLGRAYLNRGLQRDMDQALPEEQATRALADASDRARRCFKSANNIGNDVNGVIAECYGLLAERDYDRLRSRVQWAQQSLGVVPGMEELEFLLAQTYDGQERIDHLTRAIELKPGFFMALLERGSRRAHLGDVRGGMEDCDEALRINPEFAEARVNRANGMLSRRDARGAIEDCDAVLRVRPSFVLAFVVRGDARLQGLDYAGAIDDYSKAIAIEPDCALAYGRRGIAKYGARIDLSGAADDLRRALTIDPNFAEAHAGLGGIAWASDKFSESADHYRRALEIAPADWDLRAKVEGWLQDVESLARDEY